MEAGWVELVILVIALGFGVREMISIRRAVQRDREAKKPEEPR